ncbi:MAG: helix-turn-helix domain-containing protein [Eubacterium sp.]|nr:helix-turn-helix domain-containing protein [Eubacterium sp.]
MNRYTDETITLKENKGNIRTIIGNNLRRLRIANSDKQKELGDILGTNQPYISSVERGKADIKAFMIPILADRYDVYAESFFNENGEIPFDLIARLLHGVALEADKDDVKDYLNELVEQILRDGKGTDFLKLFYASALTCYNYSKPMEHIKEELDKAKSEEYLNGLSFRAKMRKQEKR